MGSKTLRDVVIAGGGVMGLSTAFNLCNYMNPRGICVVEKDPSYARSATALSWASIRQQFSLTENILLSQKSVKFIKDIDHHLGVPDDTPVDINYTHGSYLFLARKRTSHLLDENIDTQKSAGVEVRRYNQSQLKDKYPYLNVADIEVGADCAADEGWFDPWLLLSAYRTKLRLLGVEILRGEVVEIRPDRVLQVKEEDGKLNTIHYEKFVNATGIHARFTNELLNKALPSTQRFTLPVLPQLRQTFNIACKGGPRDLPLMCCPLRTVIRSEGPNYIVMYSGGILELQQEKLSDFGNVDDNHFTDDIWENLAYRIPAMEAIKILGGWCAYYEYNTLDQNGLIGRHPLSAHHYNINGFSGHGIQQSPAAGQCLAEIMCDVTTHIDIRNLSLQRLLDNKPYMERNIL